MHRGDRPSLLARGVAMVVALALALLPVGASASGPPLPVGFAFGQQPSGVPQAQPSAAADAEKDPKVLELRELYENAHVSFLAGRYLDAAASFDAGYAQSGMIAFLYNGAVAWEKAGNLQQAVDRYAQYLIKAPTSDDFEVVEARIDALRVAIEQNQEAQVAAVVETKGVLIITSSPAGAEIRLDHPEGPLFAVTPFTGTLPPGEHTVHLSARGYKPSQRAFPDNSGKVLIGHFALSEEYFLGQIEIKSPVVGADIYMKMVADASGHEVPPDTNANTPVGKTPFSNQLAPGTYEIRVEKRGYKSVTKVMEVAQGKVRTIEIKLDVVDTGTVKFENATPASEGAQVFLGESHLCDVPCEAKLEPGVHEINVRMDKKKPLNFELDVKQADEVVIDVTMEPKTKRAPAYVTGVFMLGAAGTGTFFALRANKTEKAIKSDLDNFVQIDTDDPRRKSGLVDAVVADSLFGATLIFGILTIYYAFRQTGEPSRGEVRTDAIAGRAKPSFGVSPVITKETLGVSTLVRF